MSTIITRNSANSGSTPSSLVQGELAINVTDGRLFYGSGSGNVVKEFTGSASGGSTSPGGPNQSVQFNRNGVFSGSNNFTFNSASNALTLTGSLNITGSTLQIGNNTLLGNTTLSGSIIISGSLGTPTPTVRIYGDTTHDGYIRFDPVSTNIDTSISASYIYVSGSTNDLYFSQNGSGYNNVTRLRWLEGNLYTGLLHGGLISSASSTTFNISSGSGIVVNLNASLTTDPFPTIQFVTWGNLTNQSLTYRTSSIQTFVGIDSSGSIIQQTTPWTNGQYNTSISLGTVLHQNQSTINGSITYPNVAYGYKQRTYDFIKAFGPLKLSGYPINTSGSRGVTVGSGSAFADGRNYQVDPNNPSYITDSGTTVSKIFRYYQSGSAFVQDTNGGLGYPEIDPTQYNPGNGGVLSPVAGGQYTVQRVFWYPNSTTKAVVVYYGNTTYNSISNALANYTNEDFNEVENTKQNAVYLGAIIIKGNGSFTTSADFRIITSGLFRSAAGTGATGVTNLASLSDVTLTTPTYGDLLMYDNTFWYNTKQLTGSYGLTGSLGQGLDVKASGSYSHAEGVQTQAIGYASHAEGGGTFALGIGDHTEGFNTVANRVDSTTAYLSGSISYSGSGILYATGNVSSYIYGHHLAWYHGIDSLYYSSQISSSTYDAINGFTTINLITAPTPTDDTAGGGLIILQNTDDYSFSHAEGYQTVALGFASHAEGESTLTSGPYSHAEGAGSIAEGDYSHAEGNYTQTGIPSAYSASVSTGLVTLDASYGDISADFNPGSLLYLYDAPFDGLYVKAIFTISSSTYTTQTEVQLTDVTAVTTKAYVGDLSNINTWSGDQTIPGKYSHSEGQITKAIGDWSHAEGRGTAAIGSRSHAEGFSTKAIGQGSHAEGFSTQAIGDYSHAEGSNTRAAGIGSHVEGYLSVTIGDYSHAEGIGTIASGSYQHAQGTYNTEGNTTSLVIIGNGADDNNRSDLALFNTDGIQFTQPVTGSIFSGSFTGSLNGTASFAVSASWAPGSGGVTINNNTNNYLLTATGTANTINGESNLTFDGVLLLLTGSFSHGSSNTAIGQYSHAEGGGTQANGAYSHAEGYKANASGQYSHAEGDTTQAKGFASHAEGDNTIASGSYSHAEGQNTVALGTASYAAGLGTVAKFDYQYVIGKYNSESSALFAVGNGTSTLSTSNLALFNTNGIEFTQPLTASIISGSAFTGSLFGIATSASFATTASFASTASYVNGMITKNNAVAAGSFTGNPRKATVTFTTPFPNTNYTVTVTGEDSRTWTIESKLSGSFVISSNSSVALTGNTYWQAISYGEFNS